MNWPGPGIMHNVCKHSDRKHNTNYMYSTMYMCMHPAVGGKGVEWKVHLEEDPIIDPRFPPSICDLQCETQDTSFFHWRGCLHDYRIAPNFLRFSRIQIGPRKLNSTLFQASWLSSKRLA